VSRLKLWTTLAGNDRPFTDWEHLTEARKIVERSETDWVQTEISSRKFIGCGGPGNLEEVLALFLEEVT